MSATTLAPADTTAPAVNLTAPLNGASVKPKSVVTLTATASDNIGVTTVEFYVNGALQGTDPSSPYSATWKVPGAKNRTYTIQDKAYDAAGNVGVSSIVMVTAK